MPNSRFVSGPGKARPPKLDANTKLLLFDVETNGLHGAAFAVGALIMDTQGKVVAEFKDSCPIEGEVDEWTAANVLPTLAGYPKESADAKTLRGKFWQWYRQHEGQADYTVVSNGYPVEYRFLLQCQEDDLSQRYWEHPFPLLDLSSLLVQVGVRPLINKPDYVAEKLIGEQINQHNPYWDAWVTGLAALKALRQSGQLPTDAP